MRIKESDLLKQLATDSGKTAKQVSEIVVSELLKNKVIEDTPENWGVSVFDAINEDVTEEQTANCYAAISEALGVYLKRVYFIVPDLDLMGNEIARNAAAKWKLPTANINRPEATDILPRMNIPRFGRKERVNIADTLRATNQVINN